MYQKARLRLTILYIIMSFIMLAIFSLAAISAEQAAFERIQAALSDPIQRPRLTALLEIRINTFEDNFKRRLFLFDAILLVTVSVLSYFLSGKTLQPIKEMIEKQQEFAADASHELRTPLTTITMEIEALKRSQKYIQPSYLQLFKSIQDEIIRMKHIVDGLLVLVRPEKLTVNHRSKKKINSIPLVKQAFEQMKPLAQQKNLEYTFTSEIDHVEISAAEDEIKQVVLILIDNAIKYTKSGKIKVAISVEKQKSRAVISVKDTGIGISGNDAVHIFDRFYRASPQGDIDKGAGLGLSIGKRIAQAYGGTITVKSKKDEGSTFSLYLPVAK